MRSLLLLILSLTILSLTLLSTGVLNLLSSLQLSDFSINIIVAALLAFVIFSTTEVVREELL